MYVGEEKSGDGDDDKGLSIDNMYGLLNDTEEFESDEVESREITDHSTSIAGGDIDGDLVVERKVLGLIGISFSLGGINPGLDGGESIGKGVKSSTG